MVRWRVLRVVIGSGGMVVDGIGAPQGLEGVLSALISGGAVHLGSLYRSVKRAFACSGKLCVDSLWDGFHVLMKYINFTMLCN